MSFSTDSASPAGAGPQGQNRHWQYQGRCGGFARWRPLELLAMILGFIVFWPIGLAIIAFKIWQKRSGYGGDVFSFAEERAHAARQACSGWRGPGERHAARGFGGGWGPRPTGNTAFDDWRNGELARLEEERRKLEAAEREFAAHIEQLRRARDREQFEQFMRDRQSRGPDAGPAQPTP
jgi:Protein of unknown function (DUF2852)